MTTGVLLAPSSRATSDGTDLNHIYCCDPDTALCGTDVSGQPETDLDEANCVVCLDLEDQPCCPTCPDQGAGAL